MLHMFTYFTHVHVFVSHLNELLMIVCFKTIVLFACDVAEDCFYLISFSSKLSRIRLKTYTCVLKQIVKTD